jgi:hypothetical protein
MKIKSACLAAALLGLAGLTGCSTISSRIESDPEGFARLPPDQQQLVRKGQIAVGFSSEAVRLALGDPTRTTTRTTASGQVLVWHYADEAYYDYGPYWGWNWGFGPPYRRFGWGWGGDPWIGYAPPPARHGPDRIRVEFQNDRVTKITQESAP